MGTRVRQHAWGGGLRGFSLPRWVAFVVAGEGAGFLLPAAGFAVSAGAGLAPWPAYVLLVVAGAGEGALLGLGQSTAVRGTAAEVPRGRWVLVTALAASAAWALGMLPSTLTALGAAPDLSAPGTWLLLGVGGALLLVSIPLAQWPVLRGVLPGAWRWVPWNVLAWLLGLPLTLVASPFVDEDSPAWLVGVLFVAGGLAMAVVVALVTGAGVRHLLARSGDGQRLRRGHR